MRTASILDASILDEILIIYQDMAGTGKFTEIRVRSCFDKTSTTLKLNTLAGQAEGL